MALILPTEFKRGMVIELEGAPHIILELWTTGTAQTKHKIHAKLRNLTTGRVVERSFQETERYETLDMQKRAVQFSYKQGNQYVFIDNDTYEEYRFSSDQLGDRIYFIKEDTECRVLILNGQAVDLEFPPTVVLRVTETAPPIAGGSDATWKPAKLETGLEIMVPLFIAPGERIRLDTEKKQYVGKEKEEKEKEKK